MGFREYVVLILLVLLFVIVIAGISQGRLNYTAAITTVAPLLGVAWGVSRSGRGDADDEG